MLPNPSKAVTVITPEVPAVTGFKKPETVKLAAAPAVTVKLVVACIPEYVAVIVHVPAYWLV